RRRHTRFSRDWSSDVCSSDLFYDPEAGQISIDGNDIALVTMHSLRSSIAYVSQHPYLFEGSIRDNIRYGRTDATDEEIEVAARRSEERRVGKECGCGGARARW